MAVQLEVHLVDASDDTPVAGAQIRAETGETSLTVASDSQGAAVIELPEKPRHLALHVQHDGYVPKLVVWDLRETRLPWPERYTLAMERAQTIGGIVRDPRGQPVSGATVLVTILAGSPHGVQPRVRNDIFESPAVTDAEGRWRFTQAPADLGPLRVRLAHPDFVSNEPIATLPAAEDFKAGTAVLTVRQGVPCTGSVTDEQGRPLEGVKVILGEGGEDSTTKPSRRSDAEGRFRFGGVAFRHSGELLALSFHRKGFAPELLELRPTSAPIEVNVVLRPGRSLRVRFVDAEDRPVPGAMLAMSGWRKHRPFHFRFEADETGQVHWEDAPADAVGFWILAENYQRDEMELTAGDDVQTIVLRRPAEISGRVIDARTREPVPQFSVVRGRDFPDRPRAWSHWNHAWPASFTDGIYRSRVGDPAIIRNREGGMAETGFRRIRISAPGYRPAVSRPIANDEEQVTWDVELEPAASVQGLVRDATGAPAAGVDIVVAAAGNPVIIESGTVRQRDNLMISTDVEGRYELPPQEDNFILVMAHPQLGYWVTSYDALSRAPDIPLRAWGRLELLTTASREDATTYFLRPVHRRENREERVHFVSTPVVAGEGVLAFEGVPAGEMLLGVHRRSMRDTDVIDIQEGQTVRLDLRSGRRMVTGLILLPAQGISVDEPLAHLRLRRQRTANAEIDWSRRADYAEIVFQVDLDGRFRIPDLLPGSYRLTALFFRSVPTAGARPEVAGVASKTFDLPDGEGEFDLGSLPILPPDT